MSKALVGSENQALKIIAKEGITRYLSRQANVEQRNKIPNLTVMLAATAKVQRRQRGYQFQLLAPSKNRLVSLLPR